ncbi:hypothetical protein HUT19_21030 [Streptomyces sp. NA02950]|uniref:hypothetical protein n=1 Tax=Streptomyces sp. NA02950 TaxID=2742137 RepID=UPI001590FD86|nr:hypothetical protein [Streptomyces sp. NA02950]QKV93934.1 hypothetical protein HUT19_21030 [Streptomyces sp. NA02950]
MHNRSIRRTRRTAAALLCAAGLALGATACNEDTAQDAGSSESPAKDKKPTAPASKGSDTGNNGGSGSDQDSGGTGGTDDKAVDADANKTIPLGQKSALTYKRSKKVATLEVAAQSVAKGSQADLSGLRLESEAKSLQPYYVTMTFKNIGDNSLKYPFLNTPTSLRDGKGNGAKTLITSDDAVKSCPGKDPDDFGPGANATICKIFLLPKGETPSVVYYTGDFDKGPVYWKATKD